MTTPLAELLTTVPSLDDPAESFTYEVDGDSIVAYSFDTSRTKKPLFG